MEIFNEAIRITNCSSTICFGNSYGGYSHKIYNADDINSSNKKKFGELYSNTMEREKFLKENGFNVVSIWEYDFYKRGSND